MMADPIAVVLDGDALFAPRTGIGTYTRQLVQGLSTSPEVSDVRVFAHGRLFTPDRCLVVGTVDQPNSRASSLDRAMTWLRPRLARSRLVTALYGRAVGRVAAARLSSLKDSHVFHSPNFGAPLFQGRSVVTFHDLSIQLFPQFHPPARVAYVERSMKEAIARGTHVITDTEVVRRQVLSHFGVAEASCHVVPLGAHADFRPRNEEQCAPVLGRYGLEYRKFLLFVATIEPRKNLLNLLTAIDHLASGGKRPPPLVVVGGRGWHSEREHEQLSRMQGKGLVRYLGYAADEELHALYSAALGFVFPSFYEGFGLPVLEAMQSGTPVVTSRGTAMEEVCGDAAYLVDPANVDDLASAIARLAMDGELRSSLVRAGLERAGSFSWERCIQQTVGVYRQLT